MQDSALFFKIEKGEVEIIESKGKVIQRKAGKTLKEVYLFASENYFPPQGIIPDETLFTVPQYNTWIELMYDQNQKDILKYAHDLIDNYMGKNLTDEAKVKAGKIAAFSVGIVAIVLGIAFKGMNVSFLVGWAFAVAASANLPAILMVLFWKKTTAKGVSSSIIVGIVSALTIIITGPSIGKKFFGIMEAKDAIQPLDSPAIISFTLALLTIIVVSLATQKDNKNKIDIK